MDTYRKPSEVRVSHVEPTALASEVVVPFGKHKGKTIAEIYESGASGRGYVRWLADIGTGQGRRRLPSALRVIPEAALKRVSACARQFFADRKKAA